MAKDCVVSVKQLPKDVSDFVATLSALDQDLFLKVFADVLEDTANEVMAYLAAVGRIRKRAYTGKSQKGMSYSAVVDMDTRVNPNAPVVAGWAILFTDKDNLDLTGTFFPQDVATFEDYYTNAPLFYAHGHDPNYSNVPIGRRCETQRYEWGIWLAHELYPDHPLFDRTLKEIEAGRLCYSTDSLALIEATYNPETGELPKWPIAACSIVPNPAEPALGPVQIQQTTLKALKSLHSGIAMPALVENASKARNDKQSTMTKEDKVMDIELANIAAMLGVDPSTSPQELRAKLQEMLTVIDSMVASEASDDMMDEEVELIATALPEMQDKSTQDKAAAVGAVVKAALNVLNKQSMSDARKAAIEAIARQTSAPKPSGQGNNAPVKAARYNGYSGGYASGGHASEKQDRRAYVNQLWRQAIQQKTGWGFGQKSIAGLTSGDFGAILPNEIAKEILPLLRASNPLGNGDLNTRYYTSRGRANFTLPKMTSGTTAYYGLVGQNIPETSATLGTVVFTPKEIVAILTITNQMLEMSEFDLQGELVADMQRAINARVFPDVLSGTGDSNKSIVGLSTLATLADSGVGLTDYTGSVNAAVSLKMFQDAWLAIEERNVTINDSAGYIVNPSVWYALSKLTSTTGVPILEPDPTRANRGMLLGHPIYRTNFIPKSVDGLSNVYVGVWDNYGVYGSTDVNVFIDPYSLSNQGGGGAVRIRVGVYYDAAPVYGQAFQVLKNVKA